MGLGCRDISEGLVFLDRMITRHPTVFFFFLRSA